jgi:hypothetical protein
MTQEQNRGTCIANELLWLQRELWREQLIIFWLSRVARTIDRDLSVEIESVGNQIYKIREKLLSGR